MYNIGSEAEQNHATLEDIKRKLGRDFFAITSTGDKCFWVKPKDAVDLKKLGMKKKESEELRSQGETLECFYL